MQHFARLRFQRIAAQMVVLLLHFSESLQDAIHIVGLFRIAHRMLEGLQLVMQIARAPAAGDRFINDSAARHLFHILAEVADRQFFRHGNVALIGRFLTDNHAEKRGFAGAIRADQSHLFTGVQLKGCVDKNQLLPILLVDT